MSEAGARWVPAFASDALEAGSSRVFRDPEQARRQVAIFRLDDGTLHAVDNRCPHEGYPLAKGYVKSCVLTCAWHNFKFDLRDGKCLVGDEDVRRYDVREQDGQIEVELSDPPPEDERPARWASLEAGLVDGRLGQVARDVVRLLQGGVTPVEMTVRAVALDAKYAEYGTTHAAPVAIEAMRLRGEDSLSAALPLMQSFDLFVDANRRLAPRVLPEPSGDPAELRSALPALVEAEEAERAEALLRAALADPSYPLAEIETALYEVCAQHFLDFGHALIYQTKLFALLDCCDAEGVDPRGVATQILPAHLLRMISGTREDTLPDFEPYALRIQELEPRFEALLARQDEAQLADWDRAQFQEEILERKSDNAFDAIADALEMAVPIPRLLDALTLCAAERMLRFDIGHDHNPEVQEGWLSVTHGLTYVAALRDAVGRGCPGPAFLRLLFFAGRFLNRTRGLDGERTLPLAASGEVSIDDVLAATRARSIQSALALGQRLTSDEDAEALLRGLAELALDDHFVRPIRAGHLIKTALAALDEFRALGDDPDRERLPLAVLRYAAAPQRERQIARVVHEAVRFVRDGKVPRTLT